MMIYTTDGPRGLHKNAWTTALQTSTKNPRKLSKDASSRGPGIPGFYYFTRSLNDLDSATSLKRKRVFWLLIYAACVTLCAIQMSERVDYFLQYPMAMSLTSHRTTTWRYPDLTICPFHGLTSGKIFNATLERFCPTKTSMDRAAIECSTKHVYDLLDEPGYNLTRIWDMTGGDLWDTVIKCFYGGNVSCMNPAYWRTDHTMMGRCYTLSIPHRISHGGPWLGIHVLLKEPTQAYYSELNHLRWKILLHENNTALAYSTLTRSNMIYRQTRAALMFWQKEFYYESTPINPCTTMERVRDCLAICFDRQFRHESTCRLPFMKTLEHLELCTKSSEFRLMYKIPVHLNEFQDKIESCDCGRSCHQVTYELQPDSKSEPTNNHTRIVLYPTGPDIEVVRERRAYPFNSLVSDLGGALGLYLGICILTLMETVRFAINRAILGRA